MKTETIEKLKALVGDEGKKYEVRPANENKTVLVSSDEMIFIEKDYEEEYESLSSITVTVVRKDEKGEWSHASDKLKGAEMMTALAIVSPIFDKTRSVESQSKECERFTQSKDHQALIEKLRRLVKKHENGACALQKGNGLIFGEHGGADDGLYELAVKKLVSKGSPGFIGFLVFENYKDENGVLQTVKWEITAIDSVQEIDEILAPVFKSTNNQNAWKGNVFPLTDYIGVAHCQGWMLSKTKRRTAARQTGGVYLDKRPIRIDVPFARFSEIVDERSGVYEDERFKPLLSKIVKMYGEEQPTPCIYDVDIEVFGNEWLNHRGRRIAADSKNFYD